MRRQKKYDVKSVWDYVNMFDDLDVIEGCLIDNYVIYHDGGVVEVWEETPLNEWSSAYIRHIYRKGLPQRWETALAAL